MLGEELRIKETQAPKENTRPSTFCKDEDEKHRSYWRWQLAGHCERESFHSVVVKGLLYHTASSHPYAYSIV